MKKLILFLLLSITAFAQGPLTPPYGIKNNVETTNSTPAYFVTHESNNLYTKTPAANVEVTANKVTTITGYDTAKYPNEKAAHDALDLKLNISDLPTNLTLYPTTTASDVSGYVVMVKDIHDVRYNTTAVDVSTPTVTTTDQLVSQRISDAGVLIGQPGVFNITTFGNIRHLSGSGTATFYFKVFHRDAAGVETLICTSSVSAPVTDGGYSEFTASGVWNDGDFEATDRIVIKSYANRIAGGSDPIYQFQFGGVSPVRTLLPVPFSVVDAGYELGANKQNSLAVDGTGTKYPTVDAVNAALPKDYAKVVYVNSTSPNTATIFDLNNPPVTNDNSLKLDTANLYIGTEASTWVYNGSTYITKIVPNTSNYYLEGTLTDAGNNKTANIQRGGGAIFGNYLYSYGEIVSKKGSSDTVLSGSNFRLFNNAGSDGNIFQLNASNGVDLWNYSSGIWNKRFTFSSTGKFGIGTSSPSANLDLGNVSGNLIHIGDSTTDSYISPSYWDAYNTDFSFNTHGVFNIVFNPQGTGGSVFAKGAVKITDAPVTSAGSYDILTRNTSSGVVEKVLSNTVVGSLEFDNYNKSIWNNGSGNIGTNTSFGEGALVSNSTGGNNSAFGQYALAFNTDNSNSAFGHAALYVNSSGSDNAAFGNTAMTANTTGSKNLAIGTSSLSTNVSGSNNTAIGYVAGTHLNDKSSSAGNPNNCVFIGYDSSALSASDTNETVIGYSANGNGSNTTTIGNSNVTKTIIQGIVNTPKTYTVATLPAGVLGDFTIVTDALAPAYLGVLVGGGSVVCPVFYNGTAWIAH